MSRTGSAMTLDTSSDTSSWVSASELTEVENDHQALGTNSIWLDVIRSMQDHYPRFSSLTEEQQRLVKMKLVGEYKRLCKTYPDIIDKLTSEELNTISLQELYMRQCIGVEDIGKHQTLMTYESNIKFGLGLLKMVATSKGYDISNSLDAISGNWSQYRLSLLELASQRQQEQQNIGPLAAIGMTLATDLILSAIGTTASNYLGISKSDMPKMFNFLRGYAPQFAQQPQPQQRSQADPQDENIEIPTPDDGDPLASMAQMFGGGFDIQSIMKNLGPMFAGFMGGNEDEDDGDIDI